MPNIEFVLLPGLCLRTLPSLGKAGHFPTCTRILVSVLIVLLCIFECHNLACIAAGLCARILAIGPGGHFVNSNFYKTLV